MEMFPVISKTVAERGYDAETKQMNVRFTSGVLYAYYNVSQEEYDSIVNSESFGSKLREVVKGKEYKKL